jgi:hypothetical protein
MHASLPEQLRMLKATRSLMTKMHEAAERHCWAAACNISHACQNQRFFSKSVELKGAVFNDQRQRLCSLNGSTRAWWQ